MITLSDSQKQKLLAHWEGISTFNPSAKFHEYMKERDLEYAKWKEKSANQKAELPIRLVLAKADAARAKLSNIFISPQPIFEVTSPPDLTSVANQYTAIYEADSAYYGWKSELSVALFDGLKYNLLATEVTWEVEKSYSPVDSVTAVGNSVQAENEVIYQGNRVRRLDLYNTFWDTSVLPKQIHRIGDYAGYSELYTPSRLHRLFDQYQVPESKRQEIYDSATQGYKGIFQYNDVQLAHWEGSVSPTESAANFDIPESDIRRGGMKRSGLSVVTTIYERIIPNDYGLTDKQVKNPKSQSIIKSVIVNGQHVIAIEQQTNKHNLLPIVFAQPLDEGLGYQSKSFTHNLEDLQDVATALVTTEIKSARRMLTDRGLYDPLMINKRDINSPNPSAKIAIRPGAFGRGLSEAYFPIPYEDRAMGSRTQQVAALLPFGDEVSGLNPVSAGQFIKGNKTNDQFAESMGASGQRIMSLALNLEDSFFSVIKQITKTNIMEYQPPDKVLSVKFQQQITLNPEDLKRLVPEFKIADGLIPADRIASTEMLGMAMQMIPQIPELAMQFNVPKMFVHMLNLKGLRDLDKYEFSPEEKQAKMQQAQAMMEAQQGGQSGGQTPSQQPAQP